MVCFTMLLTCIHTFLFLCPVVSLVVQELPNVYVEKLLPFLAEQLDKSPHLQFYLRWSTLLLSLHGAALKERASSLMASLQYLQKSVLQKQSDLGKMYVGLLKFAAQVMVCYSKLVKHKFCSVYFQDLF